MDNEPPSGFVPLSGRALVEYCSWLASSWGPSWQTDAEYHSSLSPERNYIIETWNLEKEATPQKFCLTVSELLKEKALPGLCDQTPQLLECILSGNHSKWKTRGQAPYLTCSHRKKRCCVIHGVFYKRLMSMEVVQDVVLMPLTWV